MFYLKIIITENKLEKVAIKWLNDNFGNLKSNKIRIFPNTIFYKKGDKIIFEYNKKNGCVYISYDEIWSVFKSYFNMNPQQIQNITKIWVEEHYNLKVTTTDFLILDKLLGS
jgi:hypothetical protein